MAGVYDANMRGADPDDRASEGEKKRTLQAMDNAFDRLFPSVGATAACTSSTHFHNLDVISNISYQ